MFGRRINLPVKTHEELEVKTNEAAGYFRRKAPLR